MTAATAPAARTAPRTAVQPVTFGRLVAAEWVKLRSLRSTWWALALAVAFFPLLAAVQSASVSRIADDAPAGAFVGPVYVTSGLTLSQLVLCGLAVVLITAEYRTGQIRSTLAAAPRRLPVLWAKLAVLVGVTLVAGLVGVVAGWVAAAPWFEAAGMSVDLSQPEHLRLLLGVPLYLAAMAALAYGFGAVLRSSAAGIATVLGLVFVVEPAFSYIPWEPLQRFASYLPSAAGSRLVTSDAMGSVVAGSQSAALGPWAGFAVLLGWVAAALVVAAVLLRRRDA
ncbi:ABC transporter permease [Cellulomonas xylanilytica]|uniref:ABC transporter permease n=1 Tax=Cellulomonas xylanilytica TaxID=233583 RepID=A0A510V200_9CELL|nr:ABC transporter permease [Cellulomonas xylanilytica]GEK20924.1 ABC transporter permease [Cellulomonas xylanilytica]